MPAQPIAPVLAPTDAVPPVHLPSGSPGATQVASATPGAAPFAAPASPVTARVTPPGDDSFVAVGPLGPPLVLPSSGGARRPWPRWATFAGGASAVAAIILIVVLVMNLLVNQAAPSNARGNVPTTAPISTLPVGTNGPHISNLQTGLFLKGDFSSCQVQIDQPTTSFSQEDLTISVVFTATNDGSHQAYVGAALLDSKNQVVTTDGAEPLSCPGRGNYAAELLIDNVPPGQYVVGAFYSASETLPKQPEAIQPVTISA